ncbi:PREDICTED: NEP1-interacting protein 1-like [Nelumbo nucifera]|uniref:NEP1-interacting protein 1-like n=2 Tax=Nelumbo nucifera TaxID=4432 RepID=A0A1U8QAU6_NELNU|nr:PREDICTED: NEP1-interacting protein 1-like [Nelumbo nucifera]DAD47472.1 TPA_asm: hypothetical protein HUJ06_017409 [Nelumbo nucifera]
MVDFGGGVLLGVMSKAFFAALACIFALGGALVGTITGAVKGQTTETGFFRGAGIGAISGAVLAVELLESCLVDGADLLSKVALFGSLLDGKVFREWVSPAMLKAYQWQVSTLETNYLEISDIYDIDSTRGMPPNLVNKLPKFTFTTTKMIHPWDERSCTICLQDFKEGDHARKLPNCRHFFHLLCIDGWLVRHGSCPICRTDV